MMNPQKIKCVVWDLDNTLWHGILLEDYEVNLRPNIIHILTTMDRRGILHSVASKNSYEHAMQKLKEFRLDEYFLHPQINWNSKSSSISEIAKSLNLGLDSFAFIDDQAYELDEVKSRHPQVHCLHANDIDTLLERPEFKPLFVTNDASRRRIMYKNDLARKQAERAFEGPQEEFLASLGMRLKLSKVKDDDLMRAEELTIRTNQLNSTGYTYSYNELKELSENSDYLLLNAELQDRYGEYGKIGLILIETNDKLKWIIKLFIMSCRVMSRGIGSYLLNYLRKTALAKGKDLFAEFLPTDRNRMMYVTYKFSFFEEIEEYDNNLILLKSSDAEVGELPDYIQLTVSDIF